MRRICGGNERLLVRLSDVFQMVRIDLLHSPLTLAVLNASLPSLDCITAFEIALEI